MAGSRQNPAIDPSPREVNPNPLNNLKTLCIRIPMLPNLRCITQPLHRWTLRRIPSVVLVGTHTVLSVRILSRLFSARKVDHIKYVRWEESPYYLICLLWSTRYVTKISPDFPRFECAITPLLFSPSSPHQGFLLQCPNAIRNHASTRVLSTNM